MPKAELSTLLLKNVLSPVTCLLLRNLSISLPLQLHWTNPAHQPTSAPPSACPRHPSAKLGGFTHFSHLPSTLPLSPVGPSHLYLLYVAVIVPCRNTKITSSPAGPLSPGSIGLLFLVSLSPLSPADHALSQGIPSFSADMLILTRGSGMEPLPAASLLEAPRWVVRLWPGDHMGSRWTPEEICVSQFSAYK